MSRVKQANIFCLCLIGIHIFLSLLVGTFVKNTTVILLVSQFGILIPVILFTIITKQNLFELIRVKKIHLLSIPLLVIFTYAMIPVVGIINALSMMLVKNHIQNTVSDVLGEKLLPGLLLLAVLPAIVEETTYRGVFYNSYRQDKPMKGIILSAFLFGAMHMNFNQFLYATFIGFIMALVLEATDSIIGSMIVHFTFNGNSVVLMYLLPKLQKFLEEHGVNDAQAALDTAQVTSSNTQMLSVVIVLIPMAIVGVILAGGTYILIAFLNKRTEEVKDLFTIKKKAVAEAGQEKTEVEKVKYFDIYIILSLLVCLVMAVMAEL